jgi:hypothetical protein
VLSPPKEARACTYALGTRGLGTAAEEERGDVGEGWGIVPLLLASDLEGEGKEALGPVPSRREEEA